MTRAPRKALSGRRPVAKASARWLGGTRSVADGSRQFLPLQGWVTGEEASRGSTGEKLAEQLLQGNRGLMRELGVSAEVVHREGKAGLCITASSRVGAVPLLSPITARPDLGLTVEPRFAWSCAGDVMAGTGMRVVPRLLALPEVPQSERRVPPWVMSSVVLARMRTLLDRLQRRFVLTQADLPAPHGQVDWGRYAVQRLAVGRALSVPCQYPDLRNDDELRGAIQWVVRRHRDALLGQAAAGVVVRRLLDDCELLLARLPGVQPRMPAPARRAAWQQSPLNPRAFRDGIQAMDWTADERGLGGMSDLTGMAWVLDMETFFEAWVESVAEQLARRVGAQMRAGRTAATRVPLDWQPPNAGSQRSLLPDAVLQRPDVVVVLDAKYKRHAEEIERLGWSNADETLREQHRNDVLQALAYSTLFDTPRVVSVLVYPASPIAWQGLVARGRTCMRARVRSGSRHVELALAAIPMNGDKSQAGAALADLIRRPI